MSLEIDERKGFWKLAIEQQEDSGLSVSKYCKENGKSKSQFYYWKRRLSISPKPPAIKRSKEIGFIELKEASSGTQSFPNIDSSVEIRIGQCSMLFSNNTDRDLFKAAATILLEVVE